MNKIAPPEFIEWLNQLLTANNLGIREAARKIGISHPTLTDTLTKGDMPSFETCVAIAKAFGESPIAVLRKAGLLEPEPDYDPIYEELSRYAYRMTAEERAMYLAYGRVTIEEKEKKERREK